MTSKEEEAATEAQESLLYSARHGEITVVKALLQASQDGKLTLDINCKGKSKCNMGWTPLHLATYFGHGNVVEALLDAGANVDEVNDMGDTALHKASFIGNEELVIILLNRKADLYIMNGEGRTAADVSKTRDVRRLLDAAQRAERCQQERALLDAAKDGRHDDIHVLLSSTNPPNINCVDSQGNTCLHCAAYRGHARVAVLLLQNGIDTTLRNNNGQLAIDLSKDSEIRSVLSVRPVQRLQRSAARFEGPLLKKSRFLGWRPVWAVLQRGVLVYYGSRAEAAGGGARWRPRKYLDGAVLACPPPAPPPAPPAHAQLLLTFSDGDTHRLALAEPRAAPQPREQLQAWLTALRDHIAFSEHYLWAGADPAREATETMDDDCKPLGSMQDALTQATNSLALLETQLKECSAIVAALDKSVNVGNSLHHSAYMRFQHASGSGSAALFALKHCAALVQQQKDSYTARLDHEIERNRVLEESLAALARTHHDLEMSVADELSKNKRKNPPSLTSHSESREKFFDVYDVEENELFSHSEEDTMTAGLSPLGTPDSQRLSPIGMDDADRSCGSAASLCEHAASVASVESVASVASVASVESAVSAASSRGTLVSHGGHVYRNARPHRRNLTYSSQWSL